MDIQLKPVIKEKSEPQTAGQSESLLQKVKSHNYDVRSRDEASSTFCVTSLPLNCETFNMDDTFYLQFFNFCLSVLKSDSRWHLTLYESVFHLNFLILCEDERVEVFALEIRPEF